MSQEKKSEPLTCNRTESCHCGGRRRRRQIGADVPNDVFFICPKCDAADPPRPPRH